MGLLRHIVIVAVVATASLGPPALAAPEPRPRVLASEEAPAPSPTAVTGRSSPPSAQEAEEILHDQFDNAGPVSTSSQDFWPNEWNSFDDMVADDFLIPPEENWTITSISVAGAYTADGGQNSGPADWVDVSFWTNQGSLPGEIVATMNQLVPVDGLASGDFTISLGAGVALSPGTYWVAVQARVQYPENGVWRWTDRTVVFNERAAWQNPGNGFGTGCIEWETRSTTCNLDPSAPDQVYRLTGTRIQGCTIMGTPGADAITGTPGNDVICAGGGDDSVDALAGNDVVYAGPGRDTVNGGPGDDTLNGDADRDTLTGGGGSDTLDGGTAADRLRTADGVSGNDTGNGGSGMDSCVGDPGDVFTRC